MEKESSPTFQDYNPVQRAVLEGLLKTAVGIERLREKWDHATKYDESRRKFLETGARVAAGVTVATALAGGGGYVIREIFNSQPVSLDFGKTYELTERNIAIYNFVPQTKLEIDLKKIDEFIAKQGIMTFYNRHVFMIQPNNVEFPIQGIEESQKNNFLPVYINGSTRKDTITASSLFASYLTMIAKHSELANHPKGDRAILNISEYTDEAFNLQKNYLKEFTVKNTSFFSVHP